MNKKLQIFVSSTYTDLIEERQSAVEAILDAGHIPAGMELFKAGNESQLKTIYKWIDESDIYMLILGGRYGSVESKSGKSYTHLEYEYALSKDIPIFSIVLSEVFLTSKIYKSGLHEVMEQTEVSKYKLFKSQVMSKMIREVNDCKDIKIAIHSTINTFLLDTSYNLVGWVRNYNPSTHNAFDNIYSIKNEMIGHHTYLELYNILDNKIFTIPNVFYTFKNTGNFDITALSLFISENSFLKKGINNFPQKNNDKELFFFYKICDFYFNLNLMDKAEKSLTNYTFNTSKNGDAFYSLYNYLNYKKYNSPLN